jgi:hypothetical protein
MNCPNCENERDYNRNVDVSSQPLHLLLSDEAHHKVFLECFERYVERI